MRLSATYMDGRKHEKVFKRKISPNKIFYKNGQRKIDHDKVLEKYEECTKQILEAKKNYKTFKITKKLADSNTSPRNVLDYIKPFAL